jgi:type III pantothenate kinase
MNLTIDIGNSYIKMIVFDDTMPVYRKLSKKISIALLRKTVSHFNIMHTMISSVVKVDKPLLKSLAALPGFRMLNEKTALPVTNLYKTPATLGNDRLANAVAGAFLMPGKNVLIIDAGTCIKYDFVNSDAEYVGGSISPGLAMRFKAMHDYTGRLPLVKEVDAKILTGNTTSTALQTGVFIGTTEEIKGFIQRYKMKYHSLKVILTGGDAHHFAGELNLSIFAAADLVNIGLNEIIRYNAFSPSKK